MHVLLTDVLTCPRCGPDFGLVLLADEVVNRRVLAGRLGCANCRERYRVAGGFCSFAEGEAEAGALAGSADPDALTMAAMLGVTEGPGLLMVVGAGAALAGEIADLIEGVEVVAAAHALSRSDERAGVSRIGIGERIPLRSGSMRGIVLTDAASSGLIDEAARVAGRRARVAVFSNEPDVATRLEGAGLRVIASNEQATVAERTSF